MRRIAGITVGQSPRCDMTGDIRAHLAPGLELVEYGALDGMTPEDVGRQLAPDEGDEVLVSRMRDGQQAVFSGTKVVPLVQRRIDEAEAAGADAVVVLCTGSFPALRHTVPLVFPQPLFHSVARALAGGSRIAVMVPDPAQIEQARTWWGDAGMDIEVACASPYRGVEGVERAAAALRGSGCSFLCLDCMGYTCRMREAARRASGLDVLLPRTLVASTVSELMG